MKDEPNVRDDAATPRERTGRRPRADAQRSIEALLLAAKAVFAQSGVDAPVRDIAEKAGVGIGTLYRNFPQRADLVAAVFRHEVDACADAAPALARDHAPGEALARWLHRYAAFIATKRGLAPALHSGNPAFETLPAYFRERLLPALQSLLDAASAVGEARGDVDADQLLTAIARLSSATPPGEASPAGGMVSLLIDGLRAGGRTG